MTYIDTIKAFSESVRLQKKNQSFDLEKIDLYHGLLTRGFNELVSSCFPILSRILNDQWPDLTKQIFQHTKLDNPYFTTIAKVVVDYLKYYPMPDYPFAYQLAHYEWIELELQVSALPLKQSAIESECDLMNVSVSLPSHCRLLSYDYPVHKIDVDHLYQNQSACYLFTYLINKEVKFIELNQLTYQLLYHLYESGQTANQMIEELIHLNAEFNPIELEAQLKPLLQDLYNHGALSFLK